LHKKKQDSQIISTDAGTIIVVKPLKENADFSSRDNFESAANEIDVSDLQFEKQDSQIISTDAGTIIAVKPLKENADFSSRDNFESTANEIDVSDSQDAKHPSQITSTQQPIRIVAPFP
jgi:hypothetical protein